MTMFKIIATVAALQGYDDGVSSDVFVSKVECMKQLDARKVEMLLDAFHHGWEPYSIAISCVRTDMLNPESQGTPA
jgi:hypothetical protein